MQTFPAIQAASVSADLDTLSCTSGGDCTATGESSDNALRVFSVSEIKGTWSAAKPIPGFASLPIGGATEIFADSLSCPSVANCTLAGAYAGNPNRTRTFVAAENNGTWGKARESPASPH